MTEQLSAYEVELIEAVKAADAMLIQQIDSPEVWAKWKENWDTLMGEAPSRTTTIDPEELRTACRVALRLVFVLAGEAYDDFSQRNFELAPHEGLNAVQEAFSDYGYDTPVPMYTTVLVGEDSLMPHADWAEYLSLSHLGYRLSMGLRFSHNQAEGIKTFIEAIWPTATVWGPFPYPDTSQIDWVITMEELE